jgi:hypothetical protein
LSGKNHNITFRTSDPNINKDLKIQVGGYYDGLRVREVSNPSQNNHAAVDIKIENLTGYPMILSSKSSGITGKSDGPVTDNGIKNRFR